MANKHRYSTYVLLLFGGIFFVSILGDATNTGIWTDETVTDTITQVTNTDNVCLGATCYTGWQLSVSTNGSINGSQICTPQNGLCTTVNNVTGNLTPGGKQGNIQFNDNGLFNGTEDLNWTGSQLDLDGELILPYDATYANPGIQFVDNKIGIGAESQHSLFIRTNGNLRWIFATASLQAFTGSSPVASILAETASTTNPVYASNSDDTTGIGFNTGATSIALIEDGVNVIDIRQGDGVGVTNGVDITTGVHITNDVSTVQALLIEAASGQSDNILEITDSAQEQLLTITSNGNLTFANGGNIYDNSTCVIIKSPGGTTYTFCD